MKRFTFEVFAAAFIALAATGAFFPSSAKAQEPDAARQEVLRTLVRDDCGSCHGMSLKGGLGPALRPADLKGKHPELIKTIILEGVAGTPMPPWRQFMNEDEARWIAAELKKGQIHARD